MCDQTNDRVCHTTGRRQAWNCAKQLLGMHKRTSIGVKWLVRYTCTADCTVRQYNNCVGHETLLNNAQEHDGPRLNER